MRRINEIGITELIEAAVNTNGIIITPYQQRLENIKLQYPNQEVYLAEDLVNNTLGTLSKPLFIDDADILLKMFVKKQGCSIGASCFSTRQITR